MRRSPWRGPACSALPRVASALALASLGCGEIIGIGDPQLGTTSAGGSGGSGGGGGAPGGTGGGGNGGSPSACEGCTGDLTWSRAYGTTGTTEATAIAVRSNGNAVVAGQADGNVDLGRGMTMSSSDGLSVIALEVDSGGNTVWSKRFTGSGDERVEGAALMPSGDVVIIGHFDTAIDFDGMQLATTGGEDAFVALLDGDTGDAAWLRAFSGADDQIARGVDVDDGGRILVIGEYGTTIQLPGGPTHASQGASDVFLVELDAGGAYVDSIVFGNAASEHGRAVAFDTAGGIVIGGDYESTLELGSVTLPNGTMIEAFVAKLGALDETIWARQLGGNNDQFACGLAARDIVAITGAFESELRFEGADEITGMYPAQQFLTVLDNDGSLVSLNGLGEIDPAVPATRVLTPAIDDAGHVEVAGWLEGTGRDGFYAKLGPDGTTYWSHIAGDTGDQQATGIGAHGESGVIAGTFEGTLSLTTAHACPGTSCMFAAGLTR